SIWSLCVNAVHFLQSVELISVLLYFTYCSCNNRDLHSFPTRRSSDLRRDDQGAILSLGGEPESIEGRRPVGLLSSQAHSRAGARDRKSTRLNSSHQIISYAVFCLQKKNKTRLELLIQTQSTLDKHDHT